MIQNDIIKHNICISIRVYNVVKILKILGNEDNVKWREEIYLVGEKCLI